MALRTSTGLVQGILMDDYGPMESGKMPSLAPFIKAANVLTNRMVRCASEKGYTHDAADLIEIESWLAAHFFKQSDKAASEETTDGASIVYQGRTEMKLDSTLYGQTAQVLDGSGCLKSIGKRITATVDWVGKLPSEQIPWWQRD